MSYLLLRTMKLARYHEENLGHFGLATEMYAHFTSPIRRYPDLVVHRALRALRLGRDPEREAHVKEQLPEWGRHLSDMERRATEAERELTEWKKVRFMADKLGEKFAGYVTGVQAFGLFVELEEVYVQGLVHVSSMTDDYYRFNEKAHRLQGENTQKVVPPGRRVEIQVARVDLERRQIDFALVDVLARAPPGARARGARPASTRGRPDGPRGPGRPGRGEASRCRAQTPRHSPPGAAERREVVCLRVAKSPERVISAHTLYRFQASGLDFSFGVTSRVSVGYNERLMDEQRLGLPGRRPSSPRRNQRRTGGSMTEARSVALNLSSKELVFLQKVTRQEYHFITEDEQQARLKLRDKLLEGFFDQQQNRIVLNLNRDELLFLIKVARENYSFIVRAEKEARLALAAKLHKTAESVFGVGASRSEE